MAFLKSSWSFILIVVVVFFLVEITESLFAPMLEGANEINNALIDAFISIIILSPFIWWLVKNTDRFEEELKEMRKGSGPSLKVLRMQYSLLILKLE